MSAPPSEIRIDDLGRVLVRWSDRGSYQVIEQDTATDEVFSPHGDLAWSDADSWGSHDDGYDQALDDVEVLVENAKPLGKRALPATLQGLRDGATRIAP